MFSFEETLNKLNKLYEEDQVCPDCGKKECDGSCKKKAGMNRSKLEMINKNPKVSTTELAKVVGDKSKSDSEKAKIIMEDKQVSYRILIVDDQGKLLARSDTFEDCPSQKQIDIYINKAKKLATVGTEVKVKLVAERGEWDVVHGRIIKTYKVTGEDRTIEEGKSSHAYYKIRIVSDGNPSYVLDQSGELEYYPNQKQLDAYIDKATEYAIARGKTAIVELAERRPDWDRPGSRGKSWRLIKTVYRTPDELNLY